MWKKVMAFTVCALMAAFLLTACSGSAYTSKENGFSIPSPKTPTVDTQKTDVGVDKLDTTTYQYETNSTAYIVTVVDYTPLANAGIWSNEDPASILKGSVNGAAEGVGGRVTASDYNIKVGGYPAATATIKPPSGYGNVNIYYKAVLKGNVLYIIMMMGEKEDTKFMNSFKFTS